MRHCRRPWMRLLLNRGRKSRELGHLNLTFAAAASTALTWAALLLLLAAPRSPRLAVVAATLLILTALLNHRVLLFFRRVRGLRFAAAALPLVLLYHFSNGASAVLGLVASVLDRRESSAGT